MNMKCTSAVLMLAAGTCLWAQDPVKEDVLVFKAENMRIHAGPGAVMAAPGAQVQFEYIAAEFGGAVVKNAPYSAEAVTETTQTLADGNRIVQKNVATIYRDGQGRTRREQTLAGIGPLSVQSAEPVKIITVSDPVAGISFTLDPQTQTAIKRLFDTTVPHIASPVGAVLTHSAERFELPVPTPHPAPGKQPAQTTVVRHVAALQQGTVEQLGKQVIEGVEAEGTREVTTIPAGQIGNERPIEMVSERWYSPRLQTVVMTKRSDPRMGETVYRMSNIILAEPPASLFQVPAGYTAKEGNQNVMFVEKKQQ
jgi:hypothetical protein